MNGSWEHDGVRAGEIAAALEQLTGKGWIAGCYEAVDSTMDKAREIAPQCSPGSPGVVLAERQHAGRGRHGRRWMETPGALYCTLIFAAPELPAGCAAYSLAVGCAAADLLETLGCPVRLKWPNDLLASDGRKLGGILLESCVHPSGRAVLIGIGINLQGVPEDLPSAAAVAELRGAVPAPHEFVVPLAAALEGAWNSFLAKGFRPFRERWLARAAGLGERLTVASCAGTVSGVCRGVDEGGALLLSMEDGSVVQVTAGEVVWPAGLPMNGQLA